MFDDKFFSRGCAPHPLRQKPRFSLYHNKVLHLLADKLRAGSSWRPALRQLPKLKQLLLHSNQIGDQGLASLLAPPTAGVLPSLQALYLMDNQITDDGCAVLASALRDGALPALKILRVDDNPVSEHAIQAMLATRPCFTEAEGEWGEDEDGLY